MQAGRRGVQIAIAGLIVALTSACGVTYRPSPTSAQDSSGELSTASVAARTVAAGKASPVSVEHLYQLPVVATQTVTLTKTSSQSSASAAAEVAPTSSAIPAAPAAPAVLATPQAPVTAEKLQPGDHGDHVKAFQRRLNDLGYLGGEPDGAYGAQTQQAVYAVQKAAGLERDGVAGPDTLAAVASGVRPAARTSGDAVEIDLDKQLLLVVRGGRVAAIFNTSTGSAVAYSEVVDGKTYTGDAQTYRGTFGVYREVDGPDKAPLGILYRPRYFDGGIAVHGAPFIPPYPASHGCARVSNFAMDLIWDQGWMPMGGTVVVY